MGKGTGLITLLGDLRDIDKYFIKNGFERVSSEIDELRASLRVGVEWLSGYDAKLKVPILNYERSMIYMVLRPQEESHERPEPHKNKVFLIDVEIEPPRPDSKWYRVKVKRRDMNIILPEFNWVEAQYNFFSGPPIDMEKFKERISGVL